MRRRTPLVWSLVLALLVTVAPPRTNAQPVFPYNLASLGVIEQATFTLLDRFFEPIDTGRFFGAAIDAANRELTRQGVTSQIGTPTFVGHPRYDFDLLANAYAAAVIPNTASIDHTALAQAVVSGLTASLNDCHTFLVPAKGAPEAQAQVKGEPPSGGIGIMVQFGADGYPIVEDVFRDTPAERAGLRMGDRIVSLDGQDVATLGEPGFRATLRQPVGETVSITLKRPGAEAPLVLAITRGQLTPRVMNYRLLQPGVGYIRVLGFSEQLDPKAVQVAYTELTAQGATGFVLDLRGNPGGLGPAAIVLLSTLIPRDSFLFANVQRNGFTQPMFAVENRWPYSESARPPVALLVNETSASAAEIVAAVAQDYGVARIFGAKTRGCLASVEMQPLLDGSMLGVTTALVVTAKGRNLNRVGVAPDVEINRTLEDLARAQDPQLERAAAWVQTGE